jgi:hypothetical protein
MREKIFGNYVNFYAFNLIQLLYKKLPKMWQNILFWAQFLNFAKLPKIIQTLRKNLFVWGNNK